MDVFGRYTSSRNFWQKDTSTRSLQDILPLSHRHARTHARSTCTNGHTRANDLKVCKKYPTCFLLSMLVFSVQARTSCTKQIWRAKYLLPKKIEYDACSDAVRYLERYPKSAEVGRPTGLERRRQLLQNIEWHGRRHPEQLRKNQGRSLCSQARPSSQMAGPTDIKISFQVLSQHRRTSSEQFSL